MPGCKSCAHKHPKKGTKEMKEYMASLRAKRKSKPKSKGKVSKKKY